MDSLHLKRFPPTRYSIVGKMQVLGDSQKHQEQTYSGSYKTLIGFLEGKSVLMEKVGTKTDLQKIY